MEDNLWQEIGGFKMKNIVIKNENGIEAMINRLGVIETCMSK